MLAELFAWWATQIRSLLPVRRLAPDAVIIAVMSSAAQPQGSLLLRQGGKEVFLGPLGGTKPAAGLPMVLRLPEGSMLSRGLSLPLAAGRELRGAIGFELDRLTPFAEGELFWGVSSPVVDRSRERLDLRLSVVPRAGLSPLLAGLARLRLTPDFIEAECGWIALDKRRGPRLRPWHGWAGLCAALALACLLIPVLRQQVALDAAKVAIAARATAAEQAEALRRQLLIAASSDAAMAQARRQEDALAVLAALTQALPDGTWLDDLSLKDGNLSLDGESVDAARLIPLLSAVPGFRNPSFTAPVTRGASGDADQFSLHVSVPVPEAK